MLKEPYTQKFYTYNSKYINNALALRPPQHESLEIFARLCDILSFRKNPMTTDDLLNKYSERFDDCLTEDKKSKLLTKLASEEAEKFYKKDLEAVRSLCPTLTSFERNFPSICFALATGIGKTRLMGACIAYLHYEKGINNFFVMAPNLTIYNKLKDDLGDTASPKYVFRGLDKFVTPPRIINGDNYNLFRQASLGSNDNIVINIFNISKLNSDSKVKDNKPACIKRLNEILGQSYFSYLQSLPDLCILMDESHHYHADKSFEVINELRPILGVEFTATPQIQNGTKKIDFKNVVYEYSLAHALNDGEYVKVPVVITRKDFRPKEYTPEQLDKEKLADGIRIHEETKSQLDIYSRNYGKQLIKPFVLVVARDTDHSKNIRDYLTSDDFFNGYYKDKVLEINSNQKKIEKDENIEKLLSLENPNNKIEIVIHVNMLKEGWDVTNLYTIVPLRTSASETLTEQTIGRGLRLPYGRRTGVECIDRLSIVSHDKYEEIINIANDPESLVRKVYYIDETATSNFEEQYETVELTAEYNNITADSNYIEQLAETLISNSADNSNELELNVQAKEVAQFIADFTSKSVIELNKQVTTYDAVKDVEARKIVQNSVVNATKNKFPSFNINSDNIIIAVNKSIDTCIQALTDKVIPIPQTVIQPFTQVKQGYYNFKLDTSNMSWHPGNDTLIGTELKENGKTFEYDPNYHPRDIVDTPENEIVRHLILYDDIDYMSTADLMYSLVNDAKIHFLTYLSDKETERVMRDRQKTIAEIIYRQMKDHFFREETSYKASKMRPFSKIETSFAGKIKTDQIYDLRASIPPGEIRNKIFNGFKKSCHNLYKFDSNTERLFAIVLENDKNILKWMRPSPKQFNIWYGSSGANKYEPDFIVEVIDKIYMVEIKASNEITNSIVLEKAKAAIKYCNTATKWNLENKGKTWEYALISHDEVHLNSSFNNLINNRIVLFELEN